jgi:hypothetical protein
MRGFLTSLLLICTLLSNGVASIARGNKAPKQSKSRVERKASKTSERDRETRTKRESRRELAKRRELIKRNPRLASLFKGEENEEVLRSDQPREAIEWYLQKRLPKGEKHLPVERYFQAKEKIKKMNRFSSARNKNLPAATEADGDLD